MNVLDLVLECGINPGRSMGRKREHHCACPDCGGDDRFRIFPEDNNGTGAYDCRGCGRHGDNVQFCRDFLGLEFKAAAQKCGREDILSNDSGKRSASRKPKPLTSPGPVVPPETFVPKTYDMPNDAWIAKAHEFAVKCNEVLLKYKKAMAWLAARGINEDAVRRYCLGWNAGDSGKPIYKSRQDWGLPLIANDSGKNKPLWIPIGLAIPYLVDGQVVSLQIRRPESEREKFAPKVKYPNIPGSYMGTVVLEPHRKAHVVIESRLDAIACAAAGREAGAISVMTVEGKPDAAAHAVLKNDLQILNALDYGDTGAGQKAAKRANSWWQSTYPENCTRWPVPQGKDPGEAFAAGVDLALWIKTGLPPVFSIESPVDRAAKIREASRQSAAFYPGEEEKAANQKGLGDVPEKIIELRDLLAASGVKLHKREGGRDLGIRKPVNYDLDKFHARIDELVFMDLEVGAYINRLPDGLIGAKGLIR